jgi:hypothetical protein
MNVSGKFTVTAPRDAVKRCETSNSLYGYVRSLRQPYDSVRTRRTAVIRSSYRASKSARSYNPTDGRRNGAPPLISGMVVNGRDH